VEHSTNSAGVNLIKAAKGEGFASFKGKMRIADDGSVKNQKKASIKKIQREIERSLFRRWWRLIN